jgi:hypothetical protein
VKDFIESVGAIGCVLIGIVALVFVSGAIAIVYLNTIGKATVNAQYQVTTHTQPYVQAHQAVLLNYYADWTSGDAAHKAAAALEICGEAALLDPTEFPSQVAQFIAVNCH